MTFFIGAAFGCIALGGLLVLIYRRTTPRGLGKPVCMINNADLALTMRRGK